MENKKIDKNIPLDQILEDTWAKATKKYGFSKHTIKHLQTLERHYKVDLENRVITIPFHFSNVNEIIEVGVGNEKNPIIKRELLAKISSLAHTIPLEFKINVDLTIDEYAGYEHSNIARCILDAFEMFHYDVNKKRSISSLKLIFLIVAGVLIFAWLFYLCSKHWFGQPGHYIHDTIHEIVYTLATVFIWEAVYMIFIYDDSYDNISRKIFTRIKDIHIFNSNNTLVKEINNSKMYESWSVETRWQKAARVAMFIAATALLCLSGCKAIDIIEIFIQYRSSPLAIASAILTIAIVIAGILGAIGAISFYRDKGPLKKFVLPFSIIELLISLSDVIIMSILVSRHTEAAIKGLVLGCINMFLAISFLVSSIILIVGHKKSLKQINKGAM